MVSAEHPFASWFLIGAAAVFVLVYGLPLLLAPRRWARAFRWEDDGSDLTEYFGRCTGALALAVIAYALRAVPDPRAHRDVFDLIAIASALMLGVHVWGAIRPRQPWTEDLEIALYGATLAVTLWIRHTLA